jgi:hypothetical protein
MEAAPTPEWEWPHRILFLPSPLPSTKEVVRNGFHRNPSGANRSPVSVCLEHFVQFDAAEQVNRQSSNRQRNETQE